MTHYSSKDPFEILCNSAILYHPGKLKNYECQSPTKTSGIGVQTWVYIFFNSLGGFNMQPWVENPSLLQLFINLAANWNH